MVEFLMVSVMSIYILIKRRGKRGKYDIMCTLIYSNKSGEKLKKYMYAYSAFYYTNICIYIIEYHIFFSHVDNNCHSDIPTLTPTFKESTELIFLFVLSVLLLLFLILPPVGILYK